MLRVILIKIHRFFHKFDDFNCDPPCRELWPRNNHNFHSVLPHELNNPINDPFQSRVDQIDQIILIVLDEASAQYFTKPFD